MTVPPRTEQENRQAAARDLAQQVLIFLSADGDRIGRFLAASGSGPQEIRAGLNDPGFLGGVIDYLLGDEALLLEFCAENEVDPTLPGRLRRILPGATPEE